MKLKKILTVVWGVSDSLLVFMVFALMAMIMLGSVGSGFNFSGREQGGDQEVLVQKKTNSGQSAPAISAEPIAYERARSSQIARSIVSTGATKLPLRQSLDIREHDRKYEIRFSLPIGVGEEQLNLDVAGNILTLMMESGQSTFIRRIRIPCDYAQESAVNHYVSNQVLFVEISKL